MISDMQFEFSNKLGRVHTNREDELDRRDALDALASRIAEQIKNQNAEITRVSGIQGERLLTSHELICFQRTHKDNDASRSLLESVKEASRRIDLNRMGIVIPPVSYPPMSGNSLKWDELRKKINAHIKTIEQAFFERIPGSSKRLRSQAVDLQTSFEQLANADTTYQPYNSLVNLMMSDLDRLDGVLELLDFDNSNNEIWKGLNSKIQKFCNELELAKFQSNSNVTTFMESATQLLEEFEILIALDKGFEKYRPAIQNIFVKIEQLETNKSSNSIEMERLGEPAPLKPSTSFMQTYSHYPLPRNCTECFSTHQGTTFYDIAPWLKQQLDIAKTVHVMDSSKLKNFHEHHLFFKQEMDILSVLISSQEVELLNSVTIRIIGRLMQLDQQKKSSNSVEKVLIGTNGLLLPISSFEQQYPHSPLPWNCKKCIETHNGTTLFDIAPWLKKHFEIAKNVHVMDFSDLLTFSSHHSFIEQELNIFEMYVSSDQFTLKDIDLFNKISGQIKERSVQLLDPSSASPARSFGFSTDKSRFLS